MPQIGSPEQQNSAQQPDETQQQQELTQEQIENFLKLCGVVLTFAILAAFDRRFMDKMNQSLLDLIKDNPNGKSILLSLITNLTIGLIVSSPVENLNDPTSNIPVINKELSGDEIETIEYGSQIIIDIAALIHSDPRFTNIFVEWVGIKNEDIELFQANNTYQVNERLLLIKLQRLLNEISLNLINKITSPSQEVLPSQNNLNPENTATSSLISSGATVMFSGQQSEGTKITQEADDQDLTSALNIGAISLSDDASVAGNKFKTS